MADTQKILVTIQSVTQVDNRVSLKTDKGYFSFFAKKFNSDDPSEPQLQMAAQGISKGSMVGVEFVEKDLGNGKTVKNLVRFVPITDEPSKPSPSKETPVHHKKDPDWDSIALGKVRHGVVIALLGSGRTEDEIYEIAPRLTSFIMTGLPPRGAKKLAPNDPVAAHPESTLSRDEIMARITSYRGDLIKIFGDEGGDRWWSSALDTAGIKDLAAKGAKGPSLSSLEKLAIECERILTDELPY